jgi:hypothetical protein
MIPGREEVLDRGREQSSSVEQCRSIVLRAERSSAQRIGIYARGGCHLRAIFSCAPLIQKVLRGTCGIYYDGLNARGRSDLILQTLQELPSEWTETVIQKLHLPPDYFQPDLFADAFTVDDDSSGELFRKDVIVLHIGADLSGRMVYRHREHRFLVDPGGGWLLNLEAVLRDLDAVSWFRQHFEPVAPLSVDEFADKFTTIIRLLRERGSPRILVLNCLAVSVDSRTHTWQLERHPRSFRWRELHLSLCELSRQLDFAVVDLDRILKSCRIRAESELIRLNPEQNQRLAYELFKIMHNMGVFD